MTGDPETATLIMQQPVNEALKMIRRALAEGGLAIAADLDMASRIGKALRIDFPPCRVLCVDCPVALLEALALDRSAAVLLPLHLVVAGQDGFTLVHLLNPAAALYNGAARNRAGCRKQTTGQSGASGRERIDPAAPAGK